MNMDKNSKPLGSRKLTAREELQYNLAYYADTNGLTQADISKETGIAQSTMSEYFSGKIYPRAEQLEKIADCFHVTVGQLTGRETADDELVKDLPIELREIARKGRKLTKSEREGLLRYCMYMYPNVFKLED